MDLLQHHRRCNHPVVAILDLYDQQKGGKELPIAPNTIFFDS